LHKQPRPPNQTWPNQRNLTIVCLICFFLFCLDFTPCFWLLVLSSLESLVLGFKG
jgi:hypothetical protein